MKTFFLTTVVSLTAAAQLFADDTTNVLADDKSRLSYAIGMMFASRWKEQGVDVDNNLVLRGLNDQQAGRPTLISQQEGHDIIIKFQQMLADNQKKMRDEMLTRNKAEGEVFLAQNKSQPGVMVMPANGMDGKTYELQYKVITEGAGEMPTAQDSVTVNYRGTFINGSEFDSSAKAGHPVQFPVARVIRGWTEALTHMKVGSKWQLFVPSELAYGTSGYSVVEPNKSLVFEVELVSIEHPQARPMPVAIPVQPLTSDIIRVPSKAEMDKGAKVEVLKPEDVQKIQQAQQGK